MSLFDIVADELFERRFGLDPANRLNLADLARRHGASEAEERAILSGRLMVGQSFGGARPEDVARLVRRALLDQGGRSVTLRISRPPFDDAGHGEIEVLAVEYGTEEDNSPRPTVS